MKNRFYTMAYMIFRRKYSNEKKIYCKNLQEKTHKEKGMTEPSQQKLLNIPSESKIIETTEESRITVKIENVTQPWLMMEDMDTSVCMADHFEVNQEMSDPVCPNSRKVSGYNVYCCVHPTIAGFEADANRVRGDIYRKVGKIYWLNLHKEPDINLDGELILSLSEVIESFEEKFPGLVHVQEPACKSAAPWKSDLGIICAILVESSTDTPIVVNVQVELSRATTACVADSLYIELELSGSLELVDMVQSYNIDLLEMDTCKMNPDENLLFKGEFEVETVASLNNGESAKNACNKDKGKNRTLKMVRNNNSSRSAKFITIHIGQAGKLTGADMVVYLLEKSRLIYQQPLERYYHAFYNLMHGQVSDLKENNLFSNVTLACWFVSQGLLTVPSIVAKATLVFANEVFDVLGFTQDEKYNIFKNTADMMHMGNFTNDFVPVGEKEQAEIKDDTNVQNAATLLGIKRCENYPLITAALYFLVPYGAPALSQFMKGPTTHIMEDGYDSASAAERENAQKVEEKPCLIALDLEQTCPLDPSPIW